MKITHKRLKSRMNLIKTVQFTKREINDPYSSEIYIKFKDGTYVYINLEQHLNSALDLVKLVGRGDALNISESKKDDITQIGPKKQDIIDELTNSINSDKNISNTIKLVIELFDEVPHIIY